jgi:hypothetical protein
MTLIDEAHAVVTVLHGPDDGSQLWMELVVDVMDQLSRLREHDQDLQVHLGMEEVARA